MSVEAELIQKVEKWKAKANAETDPFDRDLSAFIAYNIVYNLYATSANNFIDDFTAVDSPGITKRSSLLTTRTVR
jgi:hypothetical protein